MKTFWLLPLVLGCVSMAPEPVPYEDRVIEVSVPLLPEQAAPLVATVFLEYGLEVQEANTIRVVSAPYFPDPGSLFALKATLRAILSPEDPGTLIRLSGTWTVPAGSALGEAIGGVKLEPTPEPLTATCRGTCGRVWDLLVQMAWSLTLK